MFKSCHLIITLKLKIDKHFPSLVTLMDLLNKKYILRFPKLHFFANV